MQKHQVIVDIPSKDFSKEKYPEIIVKIPKEVPLNKYKVYLIKLGLEIPVRLQYQTTFWMINEGHDFSVDPIKREFRSRSELFVEHKKLLFTWGKDLKCKNGHEYSDEQNFCTECGIKLFEE